MKSVLACKACHKSLSQPVTLITKKADMFRMCDFKSCGGVDLADQKPLVPHGHALVLNFGITKHDIQARSFWEPIPSADSYLNYEDIEAQIEFTENIDRLNGCCGVSGSDGPTHVCSCGADIGTLNNDCYTWFAFSTENKQTIWKTL